jgi:hypothetical protein
VGKRQGRKKGKKIKNADKKIRAVRKVAALTRGF